MTDPAEKTAQPSQSTDPVCGMTVDPSAARANGLHSRYQETDYYFCSRGCKLDFDDDPQKFFDPGYVPSM